MNTVMQLFKQLPRRIPTSMLDRKEYITRSLPNHQNVFTIFFNGIIDRTILEQSILLSVFAEPAIACMFQENCLRPYWMKKDNLSILDIFTFLETNDDPDTVLNHFIFQEMDPTKAPQLRVLLIRHMNKDILCILLSHSLCDGSGSKEYMYLLSSLYQEISGNPDYRPEPVKYRKNLRSLRQVTKEFSFMKKIQIIKQGFNKEEFTGWQFPWEETRHHVRGHYVYRKLPVKYYDLFKNFCSGHGISLNALFLAAFFRALILICPGDSPAPRTLFVPVDLRRYIRRKEKTPICNMSNGIQINVDIDKQESSMNILGKIRDALNGKMTKFPGLEHMFEELLFFKFLPYALLKKIFEKFRDNIPVIPPILSNVGIIESDKLCFGDTAIESVYLTGSSQDKGLLVALLSYKKEFHFSTRFSGTEEDLKQVNAFLDAIINELIAVAGQQQDTQ